MRMRIATAIAGIASMLLAACGGTPATQEEIAAQMNAAREPAEARVGDVLVRASIAPSASLGDAIARRYGIERDPRTVLLLVGVRRIEGNAEASLPATLTARVRDLRGVRSRIALREIRSDGFIDYAGEVRVAPPDTLSFEIEAQLEDGTVLPLRFNRDVFPPTRG